MGDLNGDGALDVVQSGSVLFGTGDGTFASSWNLQNPLRAMGDLNRDGALDLVTSRPGATELELGVGDGSFQDPLPVYPWSNRAAIDDVDADGNLDIVIDDVIVRGAGDGTFPCAERHAIGSGRFGDVDSDGLLDLVTTNSLGVSVALNGIE